MLQRVPSMWEAVRPPHHPLRLLVEVDDPALAISDFDRYREAGMDVAICTGPGADEGSCPVLSGGRCRLLSGADVVLHRLDPRTRVAEALRGYPDGPAMVIVGGAGADVSDVAPVESQIRAVQRAAAHHGAGRNGNGPSDQA